MNSAKKLVCSVAATTVLVSTVLTTAIPVFADVADPSHQHKYTKERYLGTEQDGSYTHRVVIGTDNNGNPVYGNCTVMVETENILGSVNIVTTLMGNLQELSRHILIADNLLQVIRL